MVEKIINFLKENGIFGIFLGINLTYRKILCLFLKKRFRATGKKFRFDPKGIYTYKTIRVGDNVNLGVRPILQAPLSRIDIGNHVIFGPEVTIRGGNHRYDIVGEWIDAVSGDKKRPTDDLGVTIEDDVWIGTKAIILHGVTIGRGSIIGAGTVLRMSVPPYSLVSGNPAKIRAFRWKVEDILLHEEKLYSRENRYSREKLEDDQNRLFPNN